jgi:hypothetical protein
MDRLTENKLVLVVRPTRLDDLIAKYNTLAQARFYVEHLGADFADYQNEHRCYRQAVAAAAASLARLGRVQVLERRFLPNFVFGADDTVVVLGQDGLVANTAKYLAAQPIIGVNPDPDRWDGVLLPFTVRDLPKIIPEVFGRKRRLREVTMARAELNTGQRLYGVNDLFIGCRTHVSARYLIQVAGQQEQHSSSGIIVSTGLGSTGWLKSILTGAANIAGELAGHALPLKNRKPVAWDAPYLYFSVREPFPSKTTTTQLVFGKITGDAPMRLVSQMPENGVIFSDGIEADFLDFNAGTQATITLADKRGHLVV